VKWISKYNKVDAIIYVAALSQYNEVCYEDNNTNKLIEALNLLENLGNIEALSEIPFYLYLNKQDIFMQQLTKQNLSDAFPEIPSELNTKYTSEKKINRLMSFNSQLKQQQSWLGTKFVVKTGRKLEDLSDDVLCHILSFLKYNEVVKISRLNSSFYDLTNSDEIWMWFCQYFDPNIREDYVKSISKLNDDFPMWKNYFVKAKKIYQGNEIYNADKFIERFPRKFRGIYVTTAVDDSVKNVLHRTFDDFLRFKQSQNKK
jgi:hypothetical protein